MHQSNLYVRVNEIESHDVWSEFVGPAVYSFIDFSTIRSVNMPSVITKDH